VTKAIDPKVSTKIAPTLSKNLRRILNEQDVTAYWLAKESGVSHPQIYRFLDAKSEADPAVSSLIRICNALHCTLNDLLGM